MSTEIMGLIGAVQAAYSIAKGMGSLHVQAEVDKAVAELSGVLFTIQSKASEVLHHNQLLIEEKEQIRKKLEAFEQWSVKEKQYDLIKLRSGVLVMAPNQFHPKPTPLHWLCANCFQNKKASPLQREGNNLNGLVCMGCGSNLEVTEEDMDEFLES